MRLRRTAAALGVVFAAIAISGWAAVPASADHGGGRDLRGAIVVSRHGHDSPNCGRAFDPCATIGTGVANAPAGGRVVVLRGTYAESVTVTKQIALLGDDATIDASGLDNGIWLQGPNVSGSSVSGFKIENAIGEGILLTLVDHVTVRDNQVTHNDAGAHTTLYPPCTDNGPVPGDCGEAVHLQGTTNSQIVSNRVDHNIGGILVTDEAGPTSNNLIARNVVVDNLEDCGITMPAHVPGLGVTNNVVRDNFVAGNGGAGVLIATPGPGMAVTDNLVTGNVIVDNGEGGVQLHAHAPGQSIDNNTITKNFIGRNNTVGDTDSGDLQTTGIIVFSAFVPVHGLVVKHNVIFDDQIGIWLSPIVDASGIAHNVFAHVPTHVQQ